MTYYFPKTTLLLVFLCLFSFISLNAQSQAGGFTYGWDNYDNSDTPGLGNRPTNFDFTGLRPIEHAPATGIHPRIYFGPSEIPDIKDRLANTVSGQAVEAQIHAYATLLNLGHSNYNHNSSYGSDPDGNKWINNSGFWDSKPYYDKLIAQDPTVWDGVEIKRKHIVACLMSLEAFDCLMHQGEYDTDTQTYYDDRASTLAAAMEFWASLAINDPDVNSSGANYNNFGGTHMALCYDLNYNAMTTAQQDLVRQGLAKILPDEPQHGAYIPAYANTSNWTTLNSFQIIQNLAIEGETGYKPDLTDRWMRALHTFINYGWYSSGAGYEGLGKNYQYVTTMIACAKRGYSMLGHPHVRAYGTQFLPAIMQPFGKGFTSYDVWGGSGHDAVIGGYKFSNADAVGLKWIFPNDPKIDFVWRNYIETYYANSSTGYVYQQIRPDDSYNTYLIPAAVFAQDYDGSTSWQAQADANIETDYFAGDRGLGVMKSSTDENALATQFHCRQDLGGHTHGDKNDFTLSALGRIWVRKSYGGSQFQPTYFHSCVLIDDLGMGVGDPDGDKCRQPGTVLEMSSGEDISLMAGDATYAYTWEWDWSTQPITNDHPKLGQDNWEAVTETWNDFLVNDESEAHFDIPFYDYADWHEADRYERMVKRPYNPMEKVIRTVAMLKGDHPYMLVVDDLKKDANTHNFKWLAQMARDLEIDQTIVNLTDDNYQCDIIFKEPASEGNRRLLVRVLNNNGYDGSTPPATLDTLEYFDYFSGNPYNSNPNYVRPRLIVESNSVEPDFKIMLYPYMDGDALPTTHWNPSRDELQVLINAQEHNIAFTPDADGRTIIELLEPCRVPINISAEVIGGNVARVDFDDVLNATKYKVRYRVSGSTGWTEVLNSVSYRFLNGLMNSTTYEYQVKANCVSENSTWSSSYFFTTTDDTCDYPSTSTVTVNSSTSVTISWPAVTDASKYKIKYKAKVSGATWTELFPSANSVTLTGLMSGVNYKYKLKSKCVNGFTNWTPKAEFSMPNSFATDAEFRTTTALNIYPNPAKDVLYITSNMDVQQIVIRSLLGKELMRTISTNEIDISSLTTGIYTISFYTKTKEQVTKRFIKQ